GDGVFPPGLNPTAALVGNARSLGVRHPWLDAGAAFCRQRIEPVRDAHPALCALRFLESEMEFGADPDWARSEYEKLRTMLPELALFQPLPSAGYGLTPLDFAPSPKSPRRQFFRTEWVEAHLEVLEQGQLDDGGWSITWEPPGPASVLAWRGVRTLGAL